MKKKLLTVILAIVAIVACLFGFASCNENPGKAGTPGLQYELIPDKEEYRVISIGLAEEVDIVIPATYDGLPVTEIGINAFLGQSSLESVTIPDSVTSIGANAFYMCYSLTEIVIPDGVTSIGAYAFFNCSSLTKIVIPNSVTSIGEYAFYNCTSLQYTIEGNYKYLGNSNNPYLYLAGVSSTTITTATINEKCKFIGTSAFYYCDSLTKITIPDSVTSISDSAFGDCSSLTSVVIPDSVMSIGSGPFFNCSSLASIEVDGNNTAYKSIDGNLYTKDGKTFIQYAVGKTATSFTIPDSVTTISYGAFGGCSSLAEIVLPDSVTSIGNSAFDSCGSLTEIVIPDGVTSIGDYAFYYCSSLTEIVLPDSVTSIGYGAFLGCYSLTIYCEATTKPNGWHSYWNTSNRPVVWGYTGN